MTDNLLTSRISKKIENDLEEYMRKENIDRSTAVRKLLSGALQSWRLETALVMLERGESSFSYAAKFAGLDVWMFAEKLKESGKTWIKEDPELLRKELSRL